MTLRTTKDLPLEALRGAAAIIVVVTHIIGSFYPQWTGCFLDRWPASSAITGDIWYGLANGTAAVTLFFVLSGFVLTRRFLMTGDHRIVWRGALKRWPRLAGPVLLTVLASWLLFRLNAFRFVDAAALTGSPFLASFEGSHGWPFVPHFGDALSQGAVLTFLTGANTYNTSLWTMQYEFFGSFLAFGLALLITIPSRYGALFRPAVLIVVFLLCHLMESHYAAFPAGVALAAILPRSRDPLSWPIFSGLFLVGFYLFGFNGMQIGAFTDLAILVRHLPVADVHIVSGLMLIVAIEHAPMSLRERLSGRAAGLLGAISFPLYLVHTLVLCSLGCAVLLWTSHWASGPVPKILASLATAAGAGLFAIPLMFVNERWVRLVNRGADWVMGLRVARGRPHDGDVVPGLMR